MLYTILCYDSEAVVGAWTKEEDDAVMAKLEAVQAKLRKEGRLGPVARLGPTAKATTMRKGDKTLMIDGPFAETKEQLLGFYIMEFDSEDGAIAAARELRKANPSAVYEIRPIKLFLPADGVGAASG